MGSGPEMVVPEAVVECDGFQVKMPEVNMATLNSQVAEHCNAELRMIASQVAYMKQSISRLLLSITCGGAMSVCWMDLKLQYRCL